MKHLELYYFNFGSYYDYFQLKLNNLESLILHQCNNIIFSENIFLILKKLSLYNCNLKYSKYLLKCPNVEYCLLYSEEFDYSKIIDISSLKSLKIFKGNSKYFLLLENDVFLEKLSLDKFQRLTHNNEIKIIKKILPMNTLKKISFMIFKDINDELINLKETNKSITKMKVKINKCNLNNFFNIFPNLSILKIYSIYDYNSKKSYLEIKENPNCKIINIIIKINCCSYLKSKLSCQSIEKLQYVDFSIKEKINLNNSFPIFNSKCKIIFHNLTSFIFKSYDYKISYNIVKNIRENINKMPNLKIFEFYYENNDYDEKKFNKFIGTVLSLKFIKIIKIEFILGYKYVYDKRQKIKYSKNVLQNLFPEINLKVLYEINISREIVENKD